VKWVVRKNFQLNNELNTAKVMQNSKRGIALQRDFKTPTTFTQQLRMSKNILYTNLTNIVYSKIIYS